MKPSDWSFRELSLDELRVLHREHLSRDFPDDELKPLPLLEDLVDRGLNAVYGCFEQSELLGYYVLAQEPGADLILLDYLAVVDGKRGNGIGSLILSHLARTLTEGQYLFIESENPESASNAKEKGIRERRIAFYKRNHARLSPLRVRLFGVDFCILVICDTLPSPVELDTAYRSLYTQMIGPERTKRKLITFLP